MPTKIHIVQWTVFSFFLSYCYHLSEAFPDISSPLPNKSDLDAPLLYFCSPLYNPVSELNAADFLVYFHC